MKYTFYEWNSNNLLNKKYEIECDLLLSNNKKKQSAVGIWLHNKGGKVILTEQKTLKKDRKYLG